MRSIRHDLSVRLLVGTSILFISAGVVLGAVIRSRLIIEFDETLETKARALAALTSLEGHMLEFEFADEQLPEFATAPPLEYFQLRLPDGYSLLRSKSLAEHDLPPAPVARAGSQFANLTLPDGRNGRMVHLAIRPHREPQEPGEPPDDDEDEDHEINIALPPDANVADLVVIVAVARDRDKLDALLWSLYAVLGAMGLLVLTGIVVLVRLALQRGLRPLAEINRQIAAIGPTALDRGVQLAHPPEELRPILTTTNALLARLHEAFERERRFSGNVAHELRTPVAELRAASEVGALLPDDPQNVQRLFGDIRAIAEQMSTTVSNLLLLSRCENHHEAVTTAPVDLARMVTAAWERVAARAATREVRWEFHADARAGMLHSDPEKLGMIVQNLVDNAITHAIAGTVVRGALRAAPRGCTLRLVNEAAGLRPADITRMMEPFWRKDPARRASEHAGLGLSIVRALCEVLGIHVHLAFDHDREFIIHLTIPATATGREAAPARPAPV